MVTGFVGAAIVARDLLNADKNVRRWAMGEANCRCNVDLKARLKLREAIFRDLWERERLVNGCGKN